MLGGGQPETLGAGQRGGGLGVGAEPADDALGLLGGACGVERNQASLQNTPWSVSACGQPYACRTWPGRVCLWLLEQTLTSPCSWT